MIVRREALNDGEREVARLVNERCNEIVRRGLAAAKAEANAYAGVGQERILGLLRKRGVEIGPDDVVKPELDPVTCFAVAVTITSRAGATLSPEAS